ncbi:MAG: hypothetical protein QM820_64350 [Minicystis sp.]
MKKLAGIATLVLATAAAAPARADTDETLIYLDKGMRINLTEDGSKFVRFMTWHQFWARYDQYNPGTMIGESVKNDGLDVGIRRSRFLAYGQVTKDLLFLFHFGINNQSVVGGGFGTGDTPKKPQLFIHDVWGEYRIYKDYAFVGVGLHYWNGPSRLSGASTITFLGLDSPIFSWPNIDKTDQFGRQFGVYLKGKIEKLDYRIAVNAPFTQAGTPAEQKADYAGAGTKAVTGYFKYDFLDVEPNQLPYFAGSWLGKKRVWNLGAGFYFHPDSMAYLDKGEKKLAHQILFAVDTFVDMPLGQNAGALTAYAGFYHYDMGPNFLRNVGILNPSTAVSMDVPGSANGPGNAVPLIGTGNTYFGQVGYLLPSFMGKAGRLQPYAELRVSTFRPLSGPVIVPQAGLNWLILNHNAKLTIDYASRPVFAAPAEGKLPEEKTRKSEVTVQAQVFY